jgi:hypothetical protein
MEEELHHFQLRCELRGHEEDVSAREVHWRCRAVIEHRVITPDRRRFCPQSRRVRRSERSA